MEPLSPELLPPVWIYKRDGRLVPFEADKISRALFAATETLGRPDAFLARELTDGVVHFLAEEVNGAIPATAHIAELVVKVVRELGQQSLARAFETGHATKTERLTKPATAETVRTDSLEEIDRVLESACRPIERARS